jgi:hypothetical protein
MNIDLRKYFTPEAIVAALVSLPSLRTPVMDLLFGNVVNVPRPVVGYKDMGLPSGNIPVVRRGTQSTPLSESSGSISMIEPQPVNPSEFLSGADLNNLTMLGQTSIQQEITNIIDRLRRPCRATAEALAVQALTGKINYFMRVGGGANIPYEVDYGTIGDATAGIAKKFDAAGVKISDVVKGVAAILEVLKATADGNDIAILAGFDVFAALCDIAGANNNASIATASADGISIGGGFKIQLLASTYKNLDTGAAVPVVPAKHLLVVDKQAGHKMIYAALDSIDAGLQPLPFFATYETTKDPSGVKVIGESKPLPVVNVNGIVKAQVLT